MERSFAVIMAGGSGTRFWPRGRRTKPKQLLSFGEGETLVQTTLARVPQAIGPERTLVLTGADQVEALAAQLPEVAADNIIAEPAMRDTAPCIALAAALAFKRDPEAVTIVMAADHVIRPVEAFRECLERAVAAARRTKGLVTLGVKPTYPAEGYGYIELGEPEEDGVHEVRTFKEKPHKPEAESFLAAGNYLWNSGIFIWKASVVLDEIARRRPELRAGVEEIAAAAGTPEFEERLQRIYPTLEKISVDFAVMEHAPRRLCVPADFEWDDVGSLEALGRLNEKDGAKNVALGEVVMIDTKKCIIDNRSEGLVATLGLEDLIVVRTEDAVLVARKDDAERVKEIVKKLEVDGRERYL